MSETNEHLLNRLQFSLRALFVLVVAAALVAANWLRLYEIILEHFTLISLALTSASFYAVRRISPPRECSPRAMRRSYLGWFAVSLATVAIAFCIFARHRWAHGWDDSMWPREFPYPDSFLQAVHDWWDRSHPPPPIGIKFHGEYFTILFGINLITMFACALLGAVYGYVFGPVRLTAATWRWPARIARRGSPPSA